jgi:hypothetical protein
MRATSRWVFISNVGAFESFFRGVRFDGELVVISHNQVNCSDRVVESSNE